MMKHTQTIFAKYCGRAFSTIASSPMASSVRNSWKEQKGLGLCVAFVGGWSSHIFMNLYQRREHWYKVDRMVEESDTRSKELFDRCQQFTKVEKYLRARDTHDDGIKQRVDSYSLEKMVGKLFRFA